MGPVLNPSLIVCALLLLASLFWRRPHTRSTRLSGPPRPSFLYGHALLLDGAGDPGHIYERWAEEYGSVFTVATPLGRSKVVLTDPRAIAHFYARVGYQYGRTRQQRMNVELLAGRGILWAEGDEHARQRKVLVPAFTPSAIQNTLPLLYSVVYKLTSAWDELLSVNGHGIVDAQDCINRLSLDISGLTGFSHSFNTLQGQRSPIADIFLSFGSSKTSHLGTIVMLLATVFPPLMHLPTKRITLLNRMKQASRELAKELLARARTALEGEEKDGNEDKSMLGLLAREYVKASSKESEDEIAAQIGILVLAGFETTAVTLTWALIELCLNPIIQSKLRDELMASCTSADPSWDDLSRSNLPYLDAVVHEALRFHPAISETTRIANEDDIIALSAPLTLPSGVSTERLHISRGTLVTAPIAAINRSAAIWGEDAKLFRPERWLTGDGGATKEAASVQGYRHLLTFADGPRTCLGRQFAVIELKVLLAALLRRYTFALPFGTDTKIGQHKGFLPRPKVDGEEGSRVPMIIKHVEPE